MWKHVLIDEKQNIDFTDIVLRYGVSFTNTEVDLTF
jgi:hypothetical protein